MNNQKNTVSAMEIADEILKSGMPIITPAVITPAAITRTIHVIASRVTETAENSADLIKAEFVLDKNGFIGWLKSQTYTVLYHSQIQIDGIHVYAKAEKLYFAGASGAKHGEEDAYNSLIKQGFEFPANWKDKKAYCNMVKNQLAILRANSKLSKEPDSVIELSADFIYSAEFDKLKSPVEALVE